MTASFSYHPSSYRDPSGFIFEKDGVLYRQVNQSFQKNFDQFIESGLYQSLVEKNILIPHQTINDNLTGSGSYYLTLRPELVAFISYPYEWCFNMLKDAALVTLEAANEAMNFGMMLKDASAYNVQFHKGRMRFIDTLSFEPYDEQKPWIAYRQFCEHFFAPLSLMHYLKEPLQSLFIAYPEGIPLRVASKMLPLKSKLSLHNYLHLHLQSSLAGKDKAANESTKPFSNQKMKNLLQSLEEGIRSFSFSERSGVWSEYYEEANKRNNYVAAKKEMIANCLTELSFTTALDAGCNEGEFSGLLSNNTSNIVSADFDHYSINKLYENLKKNSAQNILPLIIDLSNPSPSLGVNNNERTSFLARAKTDLVLALALIHHLAIGKNIPFNRIAEMFSQLGKYLIIEFVPADDEKIQIMTKHKADVVSYYTEENFIEGFRPFFSVIKKQLIDGTNRLLYLMKGYNE